MKKLLFLLLPLLLFGCKEGQLLDNLPPDTRIFIDEIKLSSTNRLNSVVRMHWSGEDQDGFVKGYELSFDNSNWSFVTSQDSTFRFDIALGSDTSNIDFWVRAIDDKDSPDPSPAYLLIPIKNSPPTARIDTIKLIPDTVFSVLSVLWEVDDLDGFETLDSTFIRLNDGPWYGLGRQFNFATLVPESPELAGQQPAIVYAGLSPQAQPVLLRGLVVGGDNRFYIRNRDIAGTLSDIDSSALFFIRTKNSDLLVIDDHGSPNPDAVLIPILDQAYPGYDRMALEENIPPFWDPTFGLFLNLYDKIFWYSDGTPKAQIGQQLYMEVAANQLQLYLNQGGKLMVSTKLPNTFTAPDKNGISTIFGFSPMDSLSSSSGQARIATDSLLSPFPGFEGDFPVLKSTSFVIGADPFYVKNPVSNLYAAQITRTGGWQGPTTMGGRTLFTNGRTNQVFFTVELHSFNGNPGTLEDLIDQVLNKEFDW